MVVARRKSGGTENDWRPVLPLRSSVSRLSVSFVVPRRVVIHAPTIYVTTPLTMLMRDRETESHSRHFRSSNMKKSDSAVYSTSNSFPTNAFVRSVFRQSVLVGSSDEIQVRLPAHFLLLRYTSQQQGACVLLLGLSVNPSLSTSPL